MTRSWQAATYLVRGVLFVFAATGLFSAQIWGIQCWTKALVTVLLESIIRYRTTAWYVNISVKLKVQISNLLQGWLNHLEKRTEKISKEFGSNLI